MGAETPERTDYGVRVLATDDTDAIARELRRVGCAEDGARIMAPKGLARMIHLTAVPVAAANVIKQEMLATGGDAALHTQAASRGVDATDVVLIDCPPSLGLLTLNALVAAEELLIPIQCEYYALEGLGQLIRTVDMVREHLNPSLRISSILLTMTDSRTNLSEQVADEVRAFFGDLVLDTAIPRSVRLSEAPGHGRSGVAYDQNSRGALAYRSAAEEFTHRTIDLRESASEAVQS
ncbi:MAG: Sporulation initiation inhibitor protein Soj [bacterium ADurb.Bin429]|nr:MAG: Sporulation initiation inhibitor protein Soj [bacterium ADurb.Bin429]